LPTAPIQDGVSFAPGCFGQQYLSGIITARLYHSAFQRGGKDRVCLCHLFFPGYCYSANNLPYSALSGVLTGDMQERNSLSSYRFVAVMVAQFVIQVFLLPLALCWAMATSPQVSRM